MTDVELGKLLYQVEYLKESVQTAQKDITTALLSRKDIEHNLIDIAKSLDRLAENAEEIEDRFDAINAKIDDHIHKTSRTFEDFIFGNIGRWVFTIVVTIVGGFIIRYFNNIKTFLLQE